MTRRLTLRTERLHELTEDELRLAGGAGFDEQFTGQTGCIVSLNPCLTIASCTRLCTV